MTGDHPHSDTDIAWSFFAAKPIKITAFTNQWDYSCSAGTEKCMTVPKAPDHE